MLTVAAAGLLAWRHQRQREFRADSAAKLLVAIHRSASATGRYLLWVKLSDGRLDRAQYDSYRVVYTRVLRDARILTIYEGTTAIQANDLVGRKTLRDRGETARRIAAEVEGSVGELRRQGSLAAVTVAGRLDAARRAFLDVVNFVVAQARDNPSAVFAGSVPHLVLAAQLVAGWQLGRALVAAERRLAEGDDVEFMRAKIVTARFFADHVLSQAPMLRERILEGASSVTDMALDAF